MATIAEHELVAGFNWEEGDHTRAPSSLKTVFRLEPLP